MDDSLQPLPCLEEVSGGPDWLDARVKVIRPRVAKPVDNANLSLDPAWAEVECSDDEEVIEWTEEDIVRVHCVLLSDVKRLANRKAPLAEKLELLLWVYTDPEKDKLPFSFANCVRVAGCSPLSTFPYFGRMEPDDIRNLLLPSIKKWLGRTLKRYPTWVRDVLKHETRWLANRLSSNPQWINQELKRLSKRPSQLSLFGWPRSNARKGTP